VASVLPMLESNKENKRELSSWNFVAIDGIIKNQLEVITIYSQNHMKHKNTICGR
jgi:hypothetical protein